MPKLPNYTLVTQKQLSKSGTVCTELSKYIWPVKEDQMMSKIRCSIVEKVYDRKKN